MLKVNISSAKKIILVLIFALFVFGGGYLVGAAGFQASLGGFPHVTISRQVPVDKNLDFSLFWQVWDKLTSTYYDKSKTVQSNMVYGAIKGMVASVGDPYTAFFTPGENKALSADLQGNFEGVGIEIGFNKNKLVVIAPLDGGPAEKAGIKAGDAIVEIKDAANSIDKTTDGMSLAEAVALIRGTQGTKVTLVVHRDGMDSDQNFDITRATIHVNSVTLTRKGTDGNIAIVKISKFGDDTESGWRANLSLLQSPAVKGIIVDLRNNPGGYFESAISIAKDFLKAGETIVTEDDGNGKTNTNSADSTGSLMSKKVVVLINKGSASAAEILASALHDNGIATLVGETSFGKGTVQEPETFDNGAGLHVTISKWLTPNGDWVNGKGISPDKKVSDGDDVKVDPVMDAAVGMFN